MARLQNYFSQPSENVSQAMPAGQYMLVAAAPQQVIWQQQLLRIAYERARAALQPPRHHARFFSVWN